MVTGLKPSETLHSNRAALQLRSELVTALDDHAKRQGWTEAEAAQRFGVTQPRAGELLHGQFKKFQLDDLVGMATRASLRVKLTIGSRE